MKTNGSRTLSLLALVLAAAAPGAGCFATEEEASSLTAEATVRPSFELFKDAANEYRFNLLAANYEVLVSSEGYSSRTAALNGVLSVLDHGGFAGNYETRTASNGQSYFNLQAGNGEIIATSETYVTHQGAGNGVASTIGAVAAYLEHWATDTGARFDVFEGANGRFYFNLHAKNGAIVLQSQSYGSEAAALNGAFSVADFGVTVGQYQVLKASNGGYYLNLLASNGQIIATSEVYNSKSNAERARDAIVALLPNVELL